MMDILQNAKRHFDAKLAGDLLSLEVPEWGEDGKPATIYFKASLSLMERDPLYQVMQQKTLSGFADALIIRSLKEDGSPLFKKINKGEIIRHFDPDVVMRVISEMGEMAAAENVEQAAGN